MQRLLHFQDARFSSDNVWCFYALNFLNRRKNQLNGNFYVDTFFKDGPKDLGQLKTQLEKGNTEWIDCLSYWSHRVRGSAGYWRAKRREVQTWIDHHAKKMDCLLFSSLFLVQNITGRTLKGYSMKDCVYLGETSKSMNKTK